MKIEAGKYYVTRGGDVVGPMVRCENVCYAYPWVGKNDDVDVYYTESGAFFVRNSDRRDLIKEHVMPSLDLTKPVQTRDGRKVRVLCTDGPGDLPVVGFIEGNVTTTQWPVGGEYYGGELRDFDLINTPAIPRTFERWFNVYVSEDTPTVIHTLPRMNRKDSDAMSILAAEHGTDSNFRRIARKRVVFTEGEWDE